MLLNIPKENEKLLHSLAYYDSLTKLPNRVLFEDRVKGRIAALKRNNKKMAILFIDMDNFKNVNDTYGHIAGNKLYSGVSIGISIYPDDATSYEELMERSDIAMYQVKKSGKNGFQGALHKKGFKISVDDFGTGYSSMSYLKKLPAETIKIDRSFVYEIEKGEDDHSIIEAIIGMGKSLGKEVVAEGSETIGQVEALKFLKCYKVQGYYFSKPLPFELFRKFVHSF